MTVFRADIPGFGVNWVDIPGFGPKTVAYPRVPFVLHPWGSEKPPDIPGFGQGGRPNQSDIPGFRSGRRPSHERNPPGSALRIMFDPIEVLDSLGVTPLGELAGGGHHVDMVLGEIAVAGRVTAQNSRMTGYLVPPIPTVACRQLLAGRMVCGRNHAKWRRCEGLVLTRVSIFVLKVCLKATFW